MITTKVFDILTMVGNLENLGSLPLTMVKTTMTMVWKAATKVSMTKTVVSVYKKLVLFQ